MGHLMVFARTVWGSKMPSLKRTEVSLSYEQCFLYLISSSVNVSIFHSAWLDTFWTGLVCCLQKTHLRSKDTHRLKLKGWKEIFHANGKEKKAWVAILISDKIDFKTKTIARDTEGPCIMIKGRIQQEDIALVNIYAPNTGAPKYVKQTLMDIKGEINRNTVIVGILTFLYFIG